MDFALKDSSIQMRSSDQRIEAVVNYLYDTSSGQKLDMVFVGSSRTMCNVVPDIISSYFDNTENRLEVINLSVNWPGFDMQMLIAEKAIRLKGAKVLMVELPYLRRYEGHKNFRIICSFEDALGQPIYGNQDYLNNVLYTPWRQIYQTLYSPFFPTPVALNEKGFKRIKLQEMELDRINTIYATKIINEKIFSEQDLAPKSPLSHWKANFLESPFKQNAKKLSQFCNTHGVQLCWIGIPKFKVYVLPRERRAWFEQFGKVIMPPPELMHHPNYWRDDSHYTIAGAKVYSTWLAETLVKLDIMNYADGHNHEEFGTK
jgi:hypothetical protein